MKQQDAVPIQPVENPILCAPYAEPDQHWLYDTRTGIPTKNPGRRSASYWFKTERTGSAQMSLLAEEERDDLPLVNALRDDVRRWRESKWENASETTKQLLRHWWREDRARRLFFCQIEAVETVIYLREILAQGKKPRWNPKLTLDDYHELCAGRNPRPHEWVAQVAQHPKLVDAPNEADPEITHPPRLQDGDGQRQDGGDGNARGMGVLQPRHESGRSALSASRVDCLSKSHHQRAIASAAARRRGELLRPV